MSAPLLAAFNAATTWQQALAAIKNTEFSAILFDGEGDDDYIDKLTALPDDQGREQAIGSGVNEIKTLFGAFASVDEIKAAVKLQIEVEYAKHEFIRAFAAASSAGEVVTVLTGSVLKNVNDDRQKLIADWSESPLPAVQNRVAELKADPYTIVLKALWDRLGDTETGSAFRDDLSTEFAAIRGERSFVSIVELIKDLDKAGDKVDALYAFNSATTTNEMVAAIKQHYVALLDDTSEDEFEFIPDGSGRQKAVADGVLEIKKFFGDLTAENLADVLDLQVSVEFNKFKFIRAVDAAANADAMADALEEWVHILNGQRQALIADWKEKVAETPNAELSARIAQLEAETYTTILKEVYDRRNEEGFLDALAQKLFSTFGSRDVVSIVAIVEEMDKTVNSPVAEGEQSVSTDEDVVLTHDIGATDPDNDTLTYSVKTNEGPTKGTVTFAGGKFIYSPAKDVNGEDTFTILISDGKHTIEQKVTVAIKAVNDAPADIKLLNNKVAENSATGTPVGQLTATDPEGGALTFALVDNAGGRFKLETVNGVTSLVVADGLKLDYEQATFHTVRVQATDSEGKSYVETLTVDLTDVLTERVTGTAAADVFEGGAGKDTFKGGNGNDKLNGGYGNDTLWGEKGKDIFVFDSKLGTSSSDRKVNFDKIKDFSVKDDSIYLDNAIFKKLGKKGTEDKPAKLSKSFFTIGDKAKDKNDYIVYNNKTGVLSYDADGSGKGKAIEFAQLGKNLKMTEKDFFVI